MWRHAPVSAAAHVAADVAVAAVVFVGLGFESLGFGIFWKRRH